MISASGVAASAPARKRSVDMEITLPNGAVARAAAPEDEGVIVRLVDTARFGFVPTLPRDNETPVVFTVWDVDAKPMHKLGTVTVETGGGMVRTDTSPSFGIRVLRVIKPK